MTNYYVSSVAYAAISTWAALTGGAATAITAGTYVRNTSPAADAAGDSHKRVWKCTTPGTTSTTEPAAWSTTTPGNDGATVTDGTVVWTEVAGREAEQVSGTWHAPAADLRSLTTAITVNSGDNVFLSSDHSESFAGSLTFPNSVNSGRSANYLSVSRTGTVPPVAADMTSGAAVSFSTASSTLTFWPLYANGITFHGTDATGGNSKFQFTGGSTNPFKYIFENCVLQLDSTGFSSTGITLGQNNVSQEYVELINTLFKTNADMNPLINVGPFGLFVWRDTPSGAWATSGTTIPTTLIGGTGGSIVLRGLDLSNLGTKRILQMSNLLVPCRVTIENCKLSTTITDASILFNGASAGDEGVIFAADNCDDASNSRNWRMFRAYYYGLVKAVSIPHRDLGASDGVTGISWAYTTITDTRLGTMPNQALPGPAIMQRYNTTGVAKTVTVECIYNGAAKLTNAQAWIDVEDLGTAGVPLSSKLTSKPATPLTTATNLTVSTKTWDATARANTHAYALGDCISVASNVGPVFFCTTAGTSAGSEPGGFASAVDGGSVTDGTAVFRAGWRMSMSVTFTPQVQGIVRVTPKFAKNNDALNYYVDPTLTIV